MPKLRIALAAIRHRETVREGLNKVKEVLGDCAQQKVDIVCFPEAYIPGLRGAGATVPPIDQPAMDDALEEIQKVCGQHGIAAIIGMERLSENRLYNIAYVVSKEGKLMGYQVKNQITPGGESEYYAADGQRSMFEIEGVKFGVVICHEGWRYPETVRWATTRGAQLIFQPQWTGRNSHGNDLTEWGTTMYEKAMQCRAWENGVYFASVNVAMNHQNSATSLIGPKGEFISCVPYKTEKILIEDIDISKADRLYAERFNPELYPS